jgi:hypothetical protein
MQPFHPPTPKPEPLPTIKTNEPPKVMPDRHAQETASPTLAPISLLTAMLPRVRSMPICGRHWRRRPSSSPK